MRHAELVLNAQKFAAIATSILIMKSTYEDMGEEVPLHVTMRYDELIKKFPSLEGLSDPIEIAERFRETTMSAIIEIASMLVNGTEQEQVTFNNIHNLLAPIVFSDEDIDLSDLELEAIIDEVSNIEIKHVALA